MPTSARKSPGYKRPTKAGELSSDMRTVRRAGVGRAAETKDVTQCESPVVAAVTRRLRMPSRATIVTHRALGRRQRMSHHQAGQPNERQTGNSTTQGTSRNMRPDDDVIADQPPHTPFEQIRSLKTHCACRQRTSALSGRPFRQTNNRRGKGQRADGSASYGDIVRGDLSFITHVIGELPERRDVEQRIGEEPQQ
jgi:hypothetical protein